MCMITHVPANVDLPEEGIYNGSITNDDGHGFAIASSAYGIEVFKSMKYHETWAALEAARAKHGPNSIVLFHSRFGTHGEMSEYNVHPFAIDDHTVMAHNGIMPAAFHPKGKDRRSDTRIFVDWVARGYCQNDNGVPSRRGARRLGQIIGSSNKLVFLSVKSGTPKVRIVNAHLGDAVGGVWYSNSGWSWRSYTYGGGRHSDWRSSSWWGDDWDPATNSWVYPGRAAESSERDAICEMCGGEVDVAASTCIDCDFCLDCKSYLDECLCYLPDWMRRDRDTSIIEIEDVAEDGYVKVDGIWVMSRTVLDPALDTA